MALYALITFLHLIDRTSVLQRGNCLSLVAEGYSRWTCPSENWHLGILFPFLQENMDANRSYKHKLGELGSNFPPLYLLLLPSYSSFPLSSFLPLPPLSSLKPNSNLIIRFISSSQTFNSNPNLPQPKPLPQAQIQPRKCLGLPPCCRILHNQKDEDLNARNMVSHLKCQNPIFKLSSSTSIQISNLGKDLGRTL